MEIDLQKLKQKVSDLETEMQKSDVVSDNKKMSQLGKEYNDAKMSLDLAEAIEKNKQDLENLRESMNTETDEEMIILTEEEVLTLQERVRADEEKLEDLINPADPNDKKDIILEIRAGTGGDEL